MVDRGEHGWLAHREVEAGGPARRASPVGAVGDGAVGVADRDFARQALGASAVDADGDRDRVGVGEGHVELDQDAADTRVAARLQAVAEQVLARHPLPGAEAADEGRDLLTLGVGDLDLRGAQQRARGQREAEGDAARAERVGGGDEFDLDVLCCGVGSSAGAGDVVAEVHFRRHRPEPGRASVKPADFEIGIGAGWWRRGRTGGAGGTRRAGCARGPGHARWPSRPGRSRCARRAGGSGRSTRTSRAGGTRGAARARRTRRAGRRPGRDRRRGRDGRQGRGRNRRRHRFALAPAALPCASLGLLAARLFRLGALLRSASLGSAGVRRGSQPLAERERRHEGERQEPLREKNPGVHRPRSLGPDPARVAACTTGTDGRGGQVAATLPQPATRRRSCPSSSGGSSSDRRRCPSC